MIMSDHFIFLLGNNDHFILPTYSPSRIVLISILSSILKHRFRCIASSVLAPKIILKNSRLLYPILEYSRYCYTCNAYHILRNPLPLFKTLYALSEAKPVANFKLQKVQPKLFNQGNAPFFLSLNLFSFWVWEGQYFWLASNKETLFCEEQNQVLRTQPDRSVILGVEFVVPNFFVT